jgi:hypothetical protein
MSLFLSCSSVRLPNCKKRALQLGRVAAKKAITHRKQVSSEIITFKMVLYLFAKKCRFVKNVAHS